MLYYIPPEGLTCWMYIITRDIAHKNINCLLGVNKNLADRWEFFHYGNKLLQISLSMMALVAEAAPRVRVLNRERKIECGSCHISNVLI